ncbi:MAG: BREX protein BrxB domain-containing protein [Chloroflexota bacterium]|nr:BREX protein BrxB domain-containing protein [Chloroflexota bacterium]
MPIPDDVQLNADFEKLRQRLDDPDALNPAHSDPIFYFVYSPSQILTMRKLLPGWIARLRNENGLEVETLSLSEVMWELVDASGRWDAWLEVESDHDLEDINESVRVVLRSGNALVEQVAERTATFRENTILFITDVELLHPYLRSRVIERYLNNKVQIPTVFFYPGRRAGQYGLHFLEFYPEDPGYRSTLVGQE